MTLMEWVRRVYQKGSKLHDIDDHDWDDDDSDDDVDDIDEVSGGGLGGRQ